ncbi:MerR family transcriptional regulator [Kiloniella antarctica]|uniref:MerR family transcriptional regulator n=1 Tax=Kiloniella antarctica TaxID=1550907 RepID=A0ABW5BRN6_9PROT
MSAAESTTKSASAFRTISEVSGDLEVPQHVLRFWETKFPQVKPLKRAGRRRYYRPEDLVILRQIKDLLYKDGYTIKGVQKLFKEGSFKSSERKPSAKIIKNNDETAAQSTEEATANPLDAFDGLSQLNQKKLLIELKKIRSLLS